jgi:DNA repair protein RadC
MIGHMRERVLVYDPSEITRLQRGCACYEPKAARMMAERVAPRRPREVEPIILSGGPGSKCRPFLTVQKDSERFAACNALADEIGPLNTPKKAFKLLEEAIGDEVNEVFGVVTLDLHLRMKSIAETGRGEPSSVMAPLVPTLQAALIDGAHAVIIFHCHPSGIEAQPSQADKDTTKSFVEAFDAVNVHFLDHVITGGDTRKRSYYSFAEDNAL